MPPSVNSSDPSILLKAYWPLNFIIRSFFSLIFSLRLKAGLILVKYPSNPAGSLALLKSVAVLDKSVFPLLKIILALVTALLKILSEKLKWAATSSR